MEIGLIWRAMLRNKTGAILIALQVAVTMAILVNAVSIIQERGRAMARPSGIDENNIFHLASVGFAAGFNERRAIEGDLAALRALPGVVGATHSNSLPLSGGGWSMHLQTEPGADTEGPEVAIYFVDEYGLDSFGLELSEGENFSRTDVNWRELSDTRWQDKAVVTRATAEALFPDDAGQALGRTVYIDDDQPVTIIGIVDRMQSPWRGWGGSERSMLVPSHTLFGMTRYILRTEPGMRDSLMPQVEALLAERDRGRLVLAPRTMDETRERFYRPDSSMVALLAFIIVLLIAVTALGIVGLASFSVNRRTRQIGTRRALGATRFAIARHFITENLLVSLLGVLLGAALTVALNVLLAGAFGLARINWQLVPAAMSMLLAVGLLASWGPARKAASVPPAVATRTV